MKNIILNITGMHCASCAKIIKMKLDKVNGVIKSEVSDERKQAVIEYDPTLTNIESLVNLITDLGYLAKEAN